jgi:hypothetical protein
LKRAAPWLLLAAVLAGAAAQLRFQGRVWFCTCGAIRLWAGDINSAENSQQLFDPYSLTHVLHGFMFFGIAAVAAARVSQSWRFSLALSAEALWEIVENSSVVIERYRTETISLGYTGDSIFNSSGDLLACAAGALLARRLGVKWALAIAVAVELGLVIWIRDSLLLNIVMLVFPLPAIKAWQAGG